MLIQTRVPELPVDEGLGRPFRVALVSDLLEERWYSMDLISDMLFDQLSTGYKSRCDVRQIRPALRRFVSSSRLTRTSSSAWMVDRLLNRHLAYRRFLCSLAPDFDLFHIVDHSYANLVTELPEERTVVTCHDLDAFRCILAPQAGLRSKVLAWAAQRTLRGMQKAAHTVFVSNSVRRTALRLGLVSDRKSSVVPMGVHPSCTPRPNCGADEAARRLLKRAEGCRILLHVGTTAPRKRVDVLLRIAAQVARELPETILVRVGGPLTEEQQRLATSLHVAHRVLQLPYLERDVLASVYRRAEVVLQPSEAEGFGLPVVEAMACGCPVIASDLEVLREVGGTAAIYCAVGDVNVWSEQVMALLGRPAGAGGFEDLSRRQRLSEHAKQFSWEETTRQVVQVYEQVVGKRGLNQL